MHVPSRSGRDRLFGNVCVQSTLCASKLPPSKAIATVPYEEVQITLRDVADLQHLDSTCIRERLQICNIRT